MTIVKSDYFRTKAKVAVIDFFTSDVLNKDPVQITRGLIQQGHIVTFVSRNKFSANSPIGFDIVHGNLSNVDFWKQLNVDACLFFSRLDPQVTDVCLAIKNAGIKLVVKADSDGTIGYPLIPNYLRIVKLRIFSFNALARHIKWRLPIKFFVGKKLKQIEIADKVVFESPGALENAHKVLDYWGLSPKTPNTLFIPNPVADDVVELPLLPKKKKLVAIGRWEDETVKNTKVLCYSLVEFLKKNPDYEVFIIGSGESIINKYLGNSDLNIKVVGVLEHQKIAECLSDARTLFMPSLLESFGLAAAEALCMGCSIVVSPIESLIFLSENQRTGVVAKGFSEEHMLDALSVDMQRWDSNYYSSEEISAYWRSALNRRVIAKKFSDLMNDLLY